MQVNKNFLFIKTLPLQFHHFNVLFPVPMSFFEDKCFAFIYEF